MALFLQRLQAPYFSCSKKTRTRHTATIDSKPTKASAWQLQKRAVAETWPSPEGALRVRQQATDGARTDPLLPEGKGGQIQSPLDKSYGCIDRDHAPLKELSVFGLLTSC